MAKSTLKPLSSYRFRYDTIVKVRDINYGGHLGNDALVGILHEARIALLRELDASELNLCDGETGIIMNELMVSFRAEGRMLDEISVLSEIVDLKAASFRVAHLVVRGETTLALAEVGLVAFNYKAKGVSPLPEAFVQRASGR